MIFFFQFFNDFYEIKIRRIDFFVFFIYPLTETISHRGVVRNGLFSDDKKYFNFLYFTVSQRFDNLMPEQNPNRYSTKQTKIYRLINSLNQSGFGYRKISKYLNSKRILSFSGKVWTPSLVYAFFKRFRQRQERLKRINRRYPIFRSKMSMRFERE